MERTAAQPNPAKLADEVFQALTDNGYGQYDDLIGVLAPALGPEGLEHLKSRMLALSGQPVGRRIITRSASRNAWKAGRDSSGSRFVSSTSDQPWSGKW